MKIILSMILLFMTSFSFAKEGYVDFEQILSKTKAGKRIENQLKKEFEDLRSNIQKKEKNLQEKQSKLQAEASLLSESEKRKRLQSLQRQAVEFQQVVEQKRNELNEYRNKLLLDVRDQLKPIVSKIAKKQGLSIVHRITDATLWVNPKMDITKTVIKAYKRKYR